MAATDAIGARRRAEMLAAAARWQANGARRETAAAMIGAFGAGAPETPMRQVRFQARQDAFAAAAELRAAGRLPLFLERKIGPTLDFLSAAPSEAARKAGRPVARIVNSIDPHMVADGFATGFLIHEGLLLTNWHVFPDKASAAGAGANFLYEQGERGLEAGLTFAIEPERFFLSQEQLDFALVAVAPQAVSGEGLDTLGVIVPTQGTSKILVGQPIDIIQYPDGGPKEYATRNNKLVDILDEGFLHYETDTLEGSSGSPAFSEAWELVALHHAGIPEVRDGQTMSVDGTPWTEEMGDDRVKWIANEGVRISTIVAALAAARIDDPAQAAMLKALLDSTADPADEIGRILAKSAGAARPAIEDRRSGGAGPLEMDMGGATFTFTGPVTINVYTGAAPAPADGAALEKSLRFDPDYANREGYDPAFLGNGLTVPPPAVAPGRDAEMYKVDGAPLVLRYHHYSLAMNQARRLQMWSAVNVDYSPEMRKTGGRTSFGDDRWVVDPRIPANIQIVERDIYGPAGQVDRGHIVRRQDNAWGATPEAVEFANSDTFHWTNCTPQHAAFNRATPPSTYHLSEGLWGGFEVYVQKELQKGDTKACILAGPVLAADDPVADFAGRQTQYPVTFWKVVAVAEADAAGTAQLRAYGFVMSQKDLVDRFGIEFAPGRFARYQRPIAEIGTLAGLVFDPLLLAADASGFADVTPNGSGGP
ncbi:endonuclease [Sphingomonas sp. MAH-20]|uniref:Endonuclease n=1 Tax=Sphingomonas horti TaxID=2682842 RepID=A0A6I4IX68_9SPHN|nr:MULTISPECIES: DNA/RNA non-specific endonuclease [Sphingomonas]MBA2920466.1 DNA/RNA non-specific endonuclease [Sphingomonas sp. CGMCC 1.13658]MVO76719.1 endonuclease [Sphingomonas horti]